jgi:transposase-like protein
MAKFTQKNKLKMIELLQEGYTLKNIAEQFNTGQAEIKFVRDQYLKGGAIGLIPHKPGRKAVNDLSDAEGEVLSSKKEVTELKAVVEMQKKLQTYVEKVRMKKEKS